MAAMDISVPFQKSRIPYIFMYCARAAGGAPVNTSASGASQNTWRSIAALWLKGTSTTNFCTPSGRMPSGTYTPVINPISVPRSVLKIPKAEPEVRKRSQQVHDGGRGHDGQREHAHHVSRAFTG